MRSRTARRIVLGVALAGTIGAILAGPLLALRWMEGSVPFSPWAAGGSPPSTDITQTIDLPKESHAFTWPARDGPRPVPTLRMRVAPTDWHGWWPDDPDRRKLALAGDTPPEVAFDVMVPDGEAIAPDTIGTLCDAHPGDPGACRIGHARLRLLRDDRDGDRLDIALGVRPPAESSRRSADGTTLPVRHAFWTRIDTRDGQRTFLGWDCQGGSTATPLTVLGSASPPVLYRCHAPDGWMERHLPGLAGVEHPSLYHACDAAGRCEMLFPFHGRLAVLDFDTLPPERDIETTRMRLFLAAWQMLNRMHVDALYPSGAVAALPAAQAQLAACRAVAEAAGGLRSAAAPGATPEAARHRIDMLVHPCRRAAAMAAAFSASAAGEAVQILSEALPALAKLTAAAPHEGALYDAWITAAAASQGESATGIALALGNMLARVGGIGRDEPGFAERETAIHRARALAAGAGGTLPDDTRALLVTALVRQYRLSDRENEAIAILEEDVEGLTQAHGAWHPLIGRPLIRLGIAQRDTGNVIGLRRTAGHLLTLWQATETAADMETPEGWNASLEAETGFAVVQFQRILARHDGSTAAAGVVPAVIARMTRRLGATHPYVRAALSGQTDPPESTAPVLPTSPATPPR